MKTFTSDISAAEFPISELVSLKVIRKSIFDTIQKEHPEITNSGKISISELNYYREKYIAGYLLKEMGQLSDLENTVLNSLKDHSTLSDKIDGEENHEFTTGQKIADKVASFGGSWTFIIIFGAILFVWILLNAVFLANKGFDPYPFILMNLILSCIAAIQAPVIMMSQKRQEEKDRGRSKNDYMVNLKAEIEIRMLHEKMDHLIMKQQQELFEIQKVQIDMMNDILSRLEKSKSQ